MHARRWWILVLVAVAQLMVVLDATIVNIALPSAQDALHFSDSERQWIITAYTLAFGSLLLVGGRIGDRRGRKPTLVVGLIGFAVASAAGGAAQSFGVLVGARALQGAFAALLAPTALSLLTTTFSDPGERGRAFGIFGSVAVSGAAVGLLLGGALTEYLSWRWCLFVNLAFAIPAAAAALALLEPGAAGSKARVDVPGALTATLGLLALVYGFNHAETHGWGSSTTLACLAAGVVLLAAFGIIERRAAHPLLPPRIVLDRTRGGCYLAVLIVGVGLFGASFFLTFYLQQTLGYSPIETGFAFLPQVGAILLTGPAASALLLPRLGPRPLVTAGMVLAAAGMAPPHAAPRRLDLRRARPARPRRHRARPGPDHRPRHQHRDGGGRARRRGRRLGHREHDAADRRLARHRAPQHAVGERREPLPRRPAAHHHRRGERHRPRLQRRVLVGGRLLRRGRRHLRSAAARRRAGGLSERPLEQCAELAEVALARGRVVDGLIDHRVAVPGARVDLAASA